MRVLAWVPQALDTSPGQRFRIEQWDPLLRRDGIQITYAPFADLRLSQTLPRRGRLAGKAWGVGRALARRLGDAWRARAFDLVYIFRESALLGPALAERMLYWNDVPHVFDFDDAVWVRYVSPANSYLSYLRFPGKTATVCRLARHVMAGNPFLASYARQHNPRVTVVPTTIDLEKYRPRDRSPGAAPAIGWTGSYSSIQYMHLLRPVLERLARRHPFRVVIVGGTGFSADGVEVEHRPWRSETEVEDLADIDIGVMPLADTEWERGKCGLKALQYMALGIPTVVSPVGVNQEIVSHGVNGLLAEDEDAWETGLERLLVDSELRGRLGNAGRETVERHYSAAVQAPRVAAVFREAVGGSHPRRFGERGALCVDGRGAGGRD